MTRITLTAEQAHGQVEAAYRGERDNAVQAARRMRTLYALAYDPVVKAEKTGWMLVLVKGAHTKYVCPLYAARARRYLTEQGLMQKEDGDEHA